MSIAKNELGGSDGTKYGAGPDERWCSEFVSWVYKEGGYPFTGGPFIMPWHLSNVRKIRRWFRRNSTFISRGILGFLDWDTD